VTTCRSCGAEIIWARTERGSRMPMDARRVMGNDKNLFVLRDHHSPEGPLAIAAWGLDWRSDPHYRSHFATCPNADQHRRRDR
jgi:hypothetical protein